MSSVGTTVAIDIEPATADDVPAIQRIISAAFSQYEAALPPAMFTAYLDDLLDVVGRMRTGDVLLAHADDQPIGTVTFYRDGGDLGMSWPSGWSAFRALAVTPTRRSRGTGRALVMTCVDRAIAARAECLGLHTAEFMTSAVDLYERCGFTRDAAHDIAPSDVLDLGDADNLPRVLAYQLATDSRLRTNQ